MDTYPDNALYKVHTVAETATLDPDGWRDGKWSRLAPSSMTTPEFEIIVVPGGFRRRRDYQDRPRVIDWIAGQAAADVVTTSVCTGAALLAKAGVLAGKRSTTHWASIGRLRERHPETTVLDDLRVVDEGKVVDLGRGQRRDRHGAAHRRPDARTEVAVATAREMEYRWEPVATELARLISELVHIDRSIRASIRPVPAKGKSLHSSPTRMRGTGLE